MESQGTAHLREGMGCVVREGQERDIPDVHSFGLVRAGTARPRGTIVSSLTFPDFRVILWESPRVSFVRAWMRFPRKRHPQFAPQTALEGRYVLDSVHA